MCSSDLLRGRGLWRRNVAEHKLCQFFLLAVAPVLENVRHTLIDLGGFLVGEHGIDDALVKPQLASVRGNFEHIVHIRADRTAVYLGRSFREGFHHVLLDLRGFGGDGVIRNLRRGQVELIRRFDVGDLFEQIHQFGQVEKLCKARPCPVACPLGNEFVKMISVSFLNSNIYPLKNLLTSRVCIALETPYSKASSHFPIASHLQ